MAFVLLPLLLAAPAGWTLVAAGEPGAAPDEAVAALPALAGAIAARGGEAVWGPAAWAPLGEVREAGGRLPDAARRAVDEALVAAGSGRFAEGARLAAEAAALLSAAPRSPGVESLEREAEIIWGLSLDRAGMGGAARHLIWALARDPAADEERAYFAPGPRRRLFARAREALSSLPRGLLQVDGTAGAVVYVDGRIAGRAPLVVIGLPAHRAWVWLEEGGRRSLAHRVEAGGGRAEISIDVAIESRLSAARGAPFVVAAAAGDPELGPLTAGLARRLAASRIVLLRRAAPDCWWSDVVAFGRSLSSRRCGQEALSELAALLVPGVEPAAEAALQEGGPVATTSAQATNPAVWYVVGGVAAAVVVGVVAYALLRPAAPAAPSTAVWLAPGNP